MGGWKWHAHMLAFTGLVGGSGTCPGLVVEAADRGLAPLHADLLAQ